LELRSLLSGNSALSDLVAGPQASLLASPPTSAPDAALAAYSPSQVQAAYGFNQSSLTGSGQTVAVVDAYDDPDIQQDLAVFDQRYGLPAANLTKVEMTSNGQAPSSDPAWSAEIALDVEWAHAVAPGASILLVEANSDSVQDLMSAVDYARNAPGVSVVSMSWGVSEFAGETDYDSYFTTPAGHTPVAFVASTGDSGDQGGPFWPAVSANVLSVGGTTLDISARGQYDGETAWSGSGGGVSTQVPEPPYQMGVQSTGQRTIPDVAYNADPTTGFSVYDSVPYQQGAGWQTVGGTSAGAPQWAGVIALADQARVAAGRNAIGNAPAAIYSLPRSDFNSVSSGDDSGSIAGGSTPATANLPGNGNSQQPGGYSLQTGLGTPVANNVISDLAAANLTTIVPAVSGAPSAVTNSPPSSTISKPLVPSPPPTSPAPLDRVAESTGDSLSGPAAESSPTAVGATTVSQVSAPTDAVQVHSVAVTLAGSNGTNAAVLTPTPAQSAAITNGQSAVGSMAFNDSSRVDSALHSLGSGSSGLVLGREIDPQVDAQPGQQDGGSDSMSTDPSQLSWPDAHRMSWPDAHRNSMARAKHAGSAVAAPVLLAKRHEIESDDGADSLSAIDHCFASGTWIERILSAHPDADLPSPVGDPAVSAAAIAGEGGQDYGIWGSGDSELSADQLWLAAAIAAGAYWQMSRKPVSDGRAGSATKSRSDFLSLTSRFREAKLAWASAHKTAPQRTTKPR
jgi:hypothetical protein